MHCTPSRDITQVGLDCEGGSLRGCQESGFGPATQTSGAAQDREWGRRGSLLLTESWVGPKRTGIQDSGPGVPAPTPGTAGFLG